ncbi:MAG: hypothetical protein K1X88_01045 [Nannocystaceae bacterium]|nr:hypothetical protein [Nannocystaceae bacterium]
MFELSQSATGQFVLVHRDSDTVMVGDDLPALWQRMREQVGELPEAQRPAPVPTVPPSPRARLGVVAVLALLPFVWLGALHVSLGRLASEVRADPAAKDGEPLEDLRARIDRVERQVEVGSRGGKRGGGKRPALAPEGKAEAEAKPDAAPEAKAAAKPEAKAGDDAKADDDAKVDDED